MKECLPPQPLDAECREGGCAEGLVCAKHWDGDELGVCLASCQTASDCGQGQICVPASSRDYNHPSFDTCAPAFGLYESCQDGQCAEGLVCAKSWSGDTYGSCQPSCQAANDCATGEVCISAETQGYEYPAFDTCAPAAGPGHGCVEGQCAEGLVCAKGWEGDTYGSCQSACQDTSDCAAGEACISAETQGYAYPTFNTCVPAAGPNDSCVEGQCAEGLVCAKSWEGDTYGTCLTSCQSSDDCATAEVCISADVQGYAYPSFNTCAPAAGPNHSCVEGQCTEGLVCAKYWEGDTYGTCLTSCQSANDCATAEVCISADVQGYAYPAFDTCAPAAGPYSSCVEGQCAEGLSCARWDSDPSSMGTCLEDCSDTYTCDNGGTCQDYASAGYVSSESTHVCP